MISWKKLLQYFSSLYTRSSSQDISNSVPKMSTEELRKFLPTFLSQDSEDAFLHEIKQFVGQSETRPFYTEALRDQSYIFQGDGLESLLIVKLPDTTTNVGKGMILSNSCDINPLNERLFDASLCYVWPLTRIDPPLLTRIDPPKRLVNSATVLVG